MSLEEKKKNKCTKCGLLLHVPSTCTNPGRICYGCWNFGHEMKNCEFKNRGELDTFVINHLFINDMFSKYVNFLLDSAASHHVVADCNFTF